MTTELAIRAVIVGMVAASAFLWPRDMRRNWAAWSRRARRVTMSVMPVFIAVGLGLIYSAYQQRPVSWATWSLALAFTILNVGLLLKFANDDTTDRQYFRK